MKLPKISLKRFINLKTLILLPFFLFFFFLLSENAFAQSDSCKKDEDDPEFHSLRPYPAKPCNENAENLSFLCGNDMILTDSITIHYSRGSCQDGGGVLNCSFDLKRGFTVDVDPAVSKLPIMGNTEDVKNKNQPSDQINDVTKVNEYVSWYLNGVTNRAEYGIINADKTEDINKLINFSGPINKLLPKRVQQNLRTATLLEAQKAKEQNKDTRHNQVAGCVNLGIVNFLSKPIWGEVVPCYGNTIVRLVDWIRGFSPWIYDHQPPKEENYATAKDYWLHYKDWRGYWCFKLFGNINFCASPHLFSPFIENVMQLFKPTFWADLFPNVPYSSTEDRIGNLKVNEPQKSGGDVEVVDPLFEINVPAMSNTWKKYSVNTTPLHFAHMEENKALSSALQTTYLPKSGADQNLGYTEPVEINPGCKILNVRSNQGDKLDPHPENNRDKELSWSRFSYRAQFECSFPYFINRWGVKIINPSTCTKTAVFTSKIDVGTPLTDEIWKNTVAGNASIFKMIFPKLNIPDGLGSIIDIPGTTPIKYDSRSWGISEAAAVSPGNPEIYFPHIGGVSEYFLTGIQTMLRPKGYGEQISFGKVSEVETGDCSFNQSKIDAAIDKAAAKYKIPASLLRAIFKIEAAPYIANPSSYQCRENSAGAAGIMAITKSTYNIVIRDSERIANDIGACGKTAGKLSRCNIDDAFEIAAKILLYNAGRMSNYEPTGGISTSEKAVIYTAAWKYYGSYKPDQYTINFGKNFPQNPNRDLNYPDLVCYLMGLCPPYLP
jgi:hypothetical protein